jgi:Uma2 family endonuclease
MRSRTAGAPLSEERRRLPAQEDEPVATATRQNEIEGEQTFVLRSVDWPGYVAINDGVVHRPNLRMIFSNGTLTLSTKSRRHEWYAERLAELVKALAKAFDLEWEDAGGATYRREEMNAGAEGDKTFYFGAHAEIMRGCLDVDLSTQPPPDLAIEVEVTHAASAAMAVWEQLGVPEVWRFDPIVDEFGFWTRRDDGHYERADVTLFFPGIKAEQILKRLQLADKIGAGRWESGLVAWTRSIRNS